MGMCPEHTRRLLEQVGEGHIMTTLAREALTGAQQALRAEDQPGPCPACEAIAAASQRALHLVLDGLLDPAHGRAYGGHAGMCLPHVLRAAKTAERSTLKLTGERLLTTLHQTRDGALELLAGLDRDAPHRARLRDALPAERTANSTVEGVRERLTIEACPACLSRGLIERQYVRWFVEHSRDDDPSIQTDPGELCSRHLHDVACADPGVAGQAMERKRASRIGELQRLLDNLAELPPPPRRRRGGRLEELDGATREFLSAHYCPACHAVGGVEHRQLELLAASLPLPPVREGYEHGPGLCVRHVRRIEGPSAQFATRHAAARVGLLAWEVQELSRKYAWAFRHELAGPEADAWLRALAQIDGRTFEGGPACISHNTREDGPE